jgi:hypothetical protein
MRNIAAAVSSFEDDDDREELRPKRRRLPSLRDLTLRAFARSLEKPMGLG